MALKGLSTPASFQDLLEDAPEEASGFLRSGLSQARQLSPTQIETLISLVKMALEDPHGTLDLPIHERLGLADRRGAMGLVTTGTFIASALQATDRPADVAGAIASHYSLGPDDAAAFRILTDAFSKKRDQFAGPMQRRYLSNLVLPSFISMEMTIDVRVAFEGGRPVVSVPVALAMLRTDAANQRVWFQASRPQLTNLIDQLSRAVQEMDRAAGLIPAAGGK